MSGIKIPVSADFNSADAEKAITKLNEQINKIAQAVATANRVKYDPVPAGSVEELKKIETKFKELTRISGALRDRMKATGQTGSSFGDLDWTRMYEDPAIRSRKMQQAYNHVTGGSRYQVNTPTPPAPGQPPPEPHHTSGFRNAAAGVAGAGLRAAGPVGGVIANAGAAGAAGGLGAGMMGLLGGLAALAVGKTVGAIKDKIDAAGQEGIGYDTLKRTLGDVNVSFELLRGTLREASDNIDVTFEQAQKLGIDFAKLSGISKDQYKTIADEVSVGGGFGRSFGVDPEQSNQFFGQMRQFGVTKDTKGSRELALMIGEAVTKSGSTAKTDEMLQAISSFTATQARNSLAGANAAGYAGSMSGLMGSKVPGLDAQGAAALLNRVNGSIAGGGSAGEAGQNYLFNVLGKKHGLDPVQSMLLQQQGAFGTGRMAFGKDSLFSKFSSKFGGGVSGGAGTSDETNLSAILSRVQKDYKSNPSLMLNATARLLGVNENQAMALHTIAPNKLTGMTGRMGRLGLDMNSLASTGISALSNIEGGSASDLKAQAAALRSHKKSLSVDELKALNKAEKEGDVEKLKDILTELTYTREQESTEGSKTRESIQGVDKRIQELATHLVPAANTMRDALILMAGGGKKGALGIGIAAAEANANEKIEGLKSQYGAEAKEQNAIVEANGLQAQERLKAESRLKERNMLDPNEANAEKARREAAVAEMQKRTKEAQDRLGEINERLKADTKAAESERDKNIQNLRGSASTATASTATKRAFEQKYGATAEGIGKDLGVDKKLILGLMGHETGWGRSIIPGSNNLGNVKGKLNGGVTATDNQNGSVDSYNKYADQDDFRKRYGDYIKRRFPRAVGAGSDGQKFINGMSGYAEDENWGRGVLNSSRGLFSTPMPAGQDGKSNVPGEQKVIVEGKFTLEGQNGARAANPITTKTVVGAPRASGV